MELKYYKSLDGVRGISALMIMVFHYSQDMYGNSLLVANFKKFAQIGQSGVTLFFVLSGFLITRILLNTKNDDSYFRNFYGRRMLRIFPLYYFFLLIYFIVIPVVFKTSIPNFKQQLIFYSYFQNIYFTFWGNTPGPGHFWSLAVEEHFYIFWPLAVYYLSLKNLIRFSTFLIILAILTRIVMVTNGFSVFTFTLTRMDAIVMGAIIAILETKGYMIIKFQKLYVTGCLLFITITALIWFFYSGTANSNIQIIKDLFISISFFLLISTLFTLNENNVILIFLTNKALTFTGMISYGLYVYHPLIYSLTKKYLIIDSQIILFLFCLINTFLISILSFYLFENRLLKFKRYFQY